MQHPFTFGNVPFTPIILLLWVWHWACCQSGAHTLQSIRAHGCILPNWSIIEEDVIIWATPQTSLFDCISTSGCFLATIGFVLAAYCSHLGMLFISCPNQPNYKPDIKICFSFQCFSHRNFGTLQGIICGIGKKIASYTPIAPSASLHDKQSIPKGLTCLNIIRGSSSNPILFHILSIFTKQLAN
jgi:hypothetical protein